MNVTEALETKPTAIVGWWTSEDGAGSLDMTGATVAEAVAELTERACSNDADRAAILAGTFELLD